jgi:hypothetical protein
MRNVPENISKIWAPVVIRKSPANESTILRMPDGTLKIFYINRPGKGDKLMSVSSGDNGISWGLPKKEFDLPGIAYHANSLILDENGNLHCVFHIYGKGENGYRGRQLNLWYCHTKNHGKIWSQPQKIFEGYVGSVRGFIELKNKRLLLVFAKAVPSRVKKPENDTSLDYGWNDIISMYSDDNGATWQTSVNSIKVEAESDRKTRYGGIEPVVTELRDGKIWMLIRTNKGYLDQSFSTDGGRSWQPPEPTDLVSSDSPAGLVNLSRNRLLIFWCSDQRWDDPDNYAAGGREVLHAAISRDEGRTWKGFREVLTSPCSGDIEKGDRGTAYPSATETSAGKVILVSGQGEAGSVVMFNPDWLEKDKGYDTFSKGLVQWTLFGADTLTELAALAGSKDNKLLVRKEGNKKNEDTEGVWNFPMTLKGMLIIQIWVNRKNKGISIALTDHFSISGDRRASRKAPLQFILKRNSENTRPSFLTIVVKWDTRDKKALLFVNGKLEKEEAFRRNAPFGLNYLRAGIPATTPDSAGYYIVSVRTKPQQKL